MRTYIKGDHLPPDRQLSLSGAGLKKYWLVDDEGNPIEGAKPFSRRFEVELYEASIGGDYQIITGKVGKPRTHESAREKEKAREQNPNRKRYKADWIKEKRKA